jgi:hypothetical protein
LGDGGSIYFGSESLSFIIRLSNFSSCSSINGNGGAIAYGSSNGRDILLYEISFSDNSVGSEKNGNDYCDVCNDNSSLPLYGCSSLRFISTNSSSDKFYHISTLSSLDVYLSDMCSLGYPVTVVEPCHDSECQSLEDIINPLFDKSTSVGIIIDAGEYNFSSVSLDGKNLLIEGRIRD